TDASLVVKTSGTEALVWFCDAADGTPIPNANVQLSQRWRVDRKWHARSDAKTTDKDGIILALLASEILAVTGESPSKHYRRLTEVHGDPAYARIDAPATREQKAALGALAPEQVTSTELAGEPITRVLTRAPGNDAPIGGLKVESASSWFAARPSGTEDVYKIYAESFRGPEHLADVQAAAREVVDAALGT
ncbi:MAG: hypothetical protein VW239_05910, partial [Candidatus Nanopelagicales bacterium]